MGFAMKKQIFQTMSNLFDIPIEIINEKSSPDSIETWDSLNHIKLIMALEEEFNVTFTDDQIVNMLNVESILLKLKELGVE